MKIRLPLSLAAVAVTLLCVNNGIAGSGETAKRGEDATERLYYFFSLEDARQRERAVDLQRLVQPFGADLEVMGIVPDVSKSDVDVSYELVARGTAQIEMSAELESFFDYENDHAVLVDEEGHVVANGSGSDLGRVLAHVGNRGVVTEIDESTWGKIKELFQ